MCGIVGYLGDGENGLARVLSAMAAILYRAPDSTGIAVFGDRDSPLRTRKAVGSVRELAETLDTRGAFPESMRRLPFLPETDEQNLVDLQRRILEFEELPLEHWEAGRRGSPAPTFRALLEEAPPTRLAPGRPGRPLTPIALPFSGIAELRRGIDHVARQYDLPAPLLRAVLRRAVLAAAERRRAAGKPVPDRLSERFERLFQAAASREEPAGWEDAEVSELLAEADTFLPGDFGPDGVRWIFRVLDAALLARLHSEPRMGEVTERRLREEWRTGGVRWLELYHAEKLANVYGRAAAAALATLQKERVLPAVKADGSPEGHSLAETIVLGITDSATLRYLLPPVIGHGRWAQQSAVSERNAHPFLDGSGTRAVALNGIFDGETEEEMYRYLTQVSQSSFRSENSSEYLALLWGHFYWVLSTDQWRFEGIAARVEGEFEGFQVGSQSVDYPVYHQTRGVSRADLDEAAFREAVEAMVRRGGEVAVVGVSSLSSGRLYVASHQRPVFLVRRRDREGFMVVSDINAALGLFSEHEIRDAREAIYALRHDRDGNSSGPEGAETREADVRRAFEVEVIPLEGPGLFARVSPEFRGGVLGRTVHITDVHGAAVEPEPFLTTLDPVRTERDLYHSLYERHLGEITERLTDVLEHYFPEEVGVPNLGFDVRFLLRRFGPRLESLRRVVLVGTGTSYNLSLAARAQLHRWLPGIEILALRPYEVVDPKREITPDRDLVVLMSWSSTTGDMVQFARDLLGRRTALLAVTEKGSADMALVARRSAGVILARTGEEVTVASVKSGPCLLTILYLLGLWLAGQRGRKVDGSVVRRRLHEVTGKIDRMLRGRLSRDFARDVAEREGPVDACTIFATDQGVAREFCIKLEQNCWNLSTRILDYQDLDLMPDHWDPSGQLVLVAATRQGEMQRAFDVMARLKERGIRFWTVAAGRSRWRELRALSEGRCIALPRVGDRFQPLLDDIFFTAFAYDYSRALGWTEEVAPRNLTKSVTIATSRPRSNESSGLELRRLRNRNEALARVKRAPTGSRTCWERDARDEVEREHYRQLRRIAAALGKEPGSPPAALSPRQDVDWDRLTDAVAEGLSNRGEILLVCLDRASLAAGRAVAPLFTPHLDRNVRVVPWRDQLPRTPEDALPVYIWSQLTAAQAHSRVTERAPAEVPSLCVGAALPDCPVPSSLGYVSVAPATPEQSFIRHFAVLSAVLTRIARGYRPQAGAALAEHLTHAGDVLAAVFGSGTLLAEARTAIRENRRYSKAFWVGPPTGIGANWIQKIASGPLPISRFLPFGESVHGPLVAVDPRIDDKQVALRPREEMLHRYGPEHVAQWERRHLGGRDVDAFLRAPNSVPSAPDSPRRVGDTWYLPVLRPDYDASQDVLAFIDATNERFLRPALDELGVYGARHARIVGLTQEAFLDLPEGRALLKYPMSRLLRLPSLAGAQGPVTIPDTLLPFVHDALAMAMTRV